MDPQIAAHHGRIVKTTGDGMLVEFASVVDAVRCAVEVQRGMAEREPEVPEERRIRFRMGINLGDVIAEEHDIFGDGVNVAARLEALAEPGGICVSRVVRDQVRDKLAFSFQDMGEQQVKNITRPIRVHRILIGEKRNRSETAKGGPQQAKPATSATRQALNRGAPVSEHERRPGTGIFRRWHGRGDHHCAKPHQMVIRHRSQFKLHV